MNDNKINISRSFSRTIQVSTYEPASFFSARSMEIPADISMEEQQAISRELFLLAQQDVANDMLIYEAINKDNSILSEAEFRNLENKVVKGEAIQVSEWEACSEIQKKILNHFKKYHKRSAEYKAQLKPRKVEK